MLPFYLPVWYWGLCREQPVEGYFLEWSTSPKPLQQNPLWSPVCETYNHSSSHKLPVPGIDDKTRRLSNNSNSWN